MASPIDTTRATIEAVRLGMFGDEKPTKLPPRTEIGVIGWVRANLFRTPFDSVVTIIASFIAISVIVTVVRWTINDANWFVITRNIRQFMSGNYPVDQANRLGMVVLLVAFAGGFTLYAYTRRISRMPLMIIGIVLAVMLITPPVVEATVPPVSTILAAGAVEIQSGTISEQPVAIIGFIARAGDQVVIQLATSTDSDTALRNVAGFADRASGAVINNAANRLVTIAEMAALQTRMGSDLLTDEQRIALNDELTGMIAPPSVVNNLALNRSPVRVRVLSADQENVIADSTLDTTTSPLVITLPEDGWYLLEKNVSDEESVALLQTIGIYPLIERNITRSLAAGGSERISQFVRITDDFTIENPRPRIDGQNIPALFITDHQYRGDRPFADYLRVAGAPFLEQLNAALIPFVLFSVIGYGAGAGLVTISRRKISELPPNESIKKPAQSASSWLWFVVLIVIAVLIYGVPLLTPLRLASLIGLFIWVGWMYFAGLHIGKAWGNALFGLLLVIGIGQSIISENLSPNAIMTLVLTTFNGEPGGQLADFGGSSWGNILAVGLWLFIGIQAAIRGANARTSWNDKLAFRGLIGTTVLWLIVVIGAFALASTLADQGIVDENNLLALTEPDDWGGLLLTLVLTVFAIIASFPIGVLLALGRRSKLPVVKYACILFIEFVRGVPLLTILFMAQLLVPLVNPVLADVPGVIRAMVGLTLFSAAYLAENVRGGLQSVPPGQEEAAKAVGLNSMQVTMLITLPQALRAVIPALVGQCIALFKDTTLVTLVGLRDLFGTAQSTVAQPEFIGLRGEVYIFISVIYFIGSYAMAYVSRRIEFSGSGASNNRNV